VGGWSGGVRAPAALRVPAKFWCVWLCCCWAPINLLHTQDAQAAQRDNNDLASAPGSRKHRVISDNDGTLWCALVVWFGNAVFGDAGTHLSHECMHGVAVAASIQCACMDMHPCRQPAALRTSRPSRYPSRPQSSHNRIAPTPKPSPVIDKLAGPKVGDGYGLGGPAAAAAADGMPPPPPLVPFAGCDRKAMPPSPAKPFAMQASPIKPSPMQERIESATTAVASKAWGARQAKMSEFFGGAKAAAKPTGASAAGGVSVLEMPSPVKPAPVAQQAPATVRLGTVADMDFWKPPPPALRVDDAQFLPSNDWKGTERQLQTPLNSTERLEKAAAFAWETTVNTLSLGASIPLFNLQPWFYCIGLWRSQCARAFWGSGREGHLPASDCALLLPLRPPKNDPWPHQQQLVHTVGMFLRVKAEHGSTPSPCQWLRPVLWLWLDLLWLWHRLTTSHQTLGVDWHSDQWPLWRKKPACTIPSYHRPSSFSFAFRDGTQWSAPTTCVKRQPYNRHGRSTWSAQHAWNSKLESSAAKTTKQRTASRFRVCTDEQTSTDTPQWRPHSLQAFTLQWAYCTFKKSPIQLVHWSQHSSLSRRHQRDRNLTKMQGVVAPSIAHSGRCGVDTFSRSRSVTLKACAALPRSSSGSSNNAGASAAPRVQPFQVRSWPSAPLKACMRLHTMHACMQHVGIDPLTHAYARTTHRTRRGSSRQQRLRLVEASCWGRAASRCSSPSRSGPRLHKRCARISRIISFTVCAGLLEFAV